MSKTISHIIGDDIGLDAPDNPGENSILYVPAPFEFPEYGERSNEN